MKKAPTPEHEEQRLNILRSLDLLNTKNEERFDKITNAAVQKFKVPISTITIIDRNEELYKSRSGIDVDRAPRGTSFCGHTLLARDIFIVEDTLKDERFADNPQVLKTPGIRFYAGVVLRHNKTQTPIGAFCIKDYKPRKLGAEEIDMLFSLAKEAEYELNRETVKK